MAEPTQIDLAQEPSDNDWARWVVEDRRVPTLGFEALVELDYGSRRFEAQLAPGAALVLCSAKGRRYKNAPRPTARDDAAKAAGARERFEALRRALQRLVTQQTHRLEAAMVARRPWTAAQFRALFIEHPVMRQLACGLVFRADADAECNKGTLMRCAGEGQLVDVDHATVTLPTSALLRLVHPLELEPEVLGAWGQHLADAALLQPFPQLQRPIHVVGDGPQVFGEVKPVALAAGLRDLGWRSVPPEDDGMVYEARRVLAGRGVRAEVRHGGFYINDPSRDHEPIGVEGLRFFDLEGQALTPEQVDPVAYSEVLYELQRVAPPR